MDDAALKQELFDALRAMRSAFPARPSAADYTVAELLQAITWRVNEWSDELGLTRAEHLLLCHWWRIDLWQIFKKHGADFHAFDF